MQKRCDSSEIKIKVSHVAEDGPMIDFAFYFVFYDWEVSFDSVKRWGNLNCASPLFSVYLSSRLIAKHAQIVQIFFKKINFRLWP